MHETSTSAANRALRTLATVAVITVAVALSAIGTGQTALAQHAYPTPEAAAAALGDAIARSDDAELGVVLGPNYKPLVPQGGVHQDDIYAFLAAWARHHAIEPDGERRARLAVGDSGWTLPMPLVKTAAGWRFDLVAGKQEIHRRKIGRNELAAIDTLHQVADAQQRYAEQVGGGRYASRLVSSAGKTDGLYWPAADQADASPLGPDALAMGPDTPPDAAFHGYYFRLLPAARGGDPKYAVVAWPTQYGKTGVNTFVMGSDGVVYQRDLGQATASRAKALRTLTPDDGWGRVPEH
ncbi:DUF2950 family protein [Cupriavidus sp. CV2]|uniref:DUF2950 family protein n=1 Tax=Cupriavidus ulmosensis TaxID=3065913 RepID=UPI00296AF15A|nr:DUF2950 family protein [Cupriavidus sp. CV2]MDW3684293.1 DUF2950 family protein [Cupriavidus sp. CV2]